MTTTSTPKPFVGDPVLFYGQSRIGVNDPLQPFAGKIIYVHSPEMVNLIVWDHAGGAHTKSSVRLRAPSPGNDSHGADQNFATWSQEQMRKHAMLFPASEFPSEAAS
jgi:hypothetical protein